MVTTRYAGRRTPVFGLALLAIVVLTAAYSVPTIAQEKAVVIPPAAADTVQGQTSSEVAVLAGGCFWGVQGVYQHVKGVTGAVSGYAGGQKDTAQYQTVGRGGTGHAESVQITFDPRQISYGRVLQIFFSVVHDPTQLNRQGPDIGPQYRSGDFPRQLRTREDRTCVHRSVEPGTGLQSRHRHENRSGSALLQRGGLSPGLSREESAVAIHHLQRSTEDQRAQEDLSRPLPAQAGPRWFPLTADAHRQFTGDVDDADS